MLLALKFQGGVVTLIFYYNKLKCKLRCKKGQKFRFPKDSAFILKHRQKEKDMLVLK
jgi:hypothetical protein